MQGKIELTGKVVYPNDPEYWEARRNWNPFTNSFPIVFVFAKKNEDVVNAIKWARENNVPIRMRSGRHALAKDGDNNFRERKKQKRVSSKAGLPPES